MKTGKTGLYFALILIIGLFIRIVLLPLGYNHDVLVNAEWGRWIYLNGFSTFYTNNVWIYDAPTQLPFVNLLYAFDFLIFARTTLIFNWITQFVSNHNLLPQFGEFWFDFFRWFAWENYRESPFANGYLMIIKLFPILADMGIAVCLYLLSKNYAKPKLGVILVAIFLFSPFSWYLSSLWAQYDQISFFLVLVAILLIDYKKRKWFTYPIASIMFFLGFEIKPTVIYLIPFFAFYFFMSKPKLRDTMLSILSVLIVFWITTQPFTSLNPLQFLTNDLYGIVFNNARYAAATHVFNLWQFIYPVKKLVDNITIIGVNIAFWTLGFWLIFTLISIYRHIKDSTTKNVFVGFYLVSASFFLLTMGMLDRYFFFGVMFLGFLVIFYKRLLWVWILTSMMYSLNLFLSWGYPFDLKIFFRFWDTQLFPIRLFSMIQMVLFIITLYYIFLVKDRVEKSINDKS